MGDTRRASDRGRPEGSAAELRGDDSERCACGSMTTLPEYREAFGVNLCRFCKSGDELLTKGKAKQLYLLADGDISHLGSLKRDNPMKPQWNSMRLYLQSQVEEAAIRKHGSLQAMDQQRRSCALMQTSKRRRDSEFDRKKEEKEKERVKATRKRIEKEWQANDLCEGARDEKRENAGGGGDDDDAVFLRTYANGMKVEVEEI